MRRYRMIQYGAGATGKFVLRAILTHPQLELVGLGVHSEQNEGRDAGTICRLPDSGIHATRDIESLLALDADCVAFLPWDPHSEDVLREDTQSGRMFLLLCRFLASGKNVIASAPNSLVHASHLGPGTMARLEDACRIGNSSFLYVGVSPGFMPDRLVLGLTQISARIDAITVREIMNYANYGNREMLMDFYGFGQDPATFDPANMLESFYRSLGGSVAMLADGLKADLDSIEMNVDFAVAETAFDIAAGRIAEGTIAAERIRATGSIAGEPRIVVEHVTRVSDSAAPDWPQFGEDGKEGYQVEIRGAPAMKVELELGAFGRNPMADAGWAVAGHLANSVIGLCDAKPGVRTFVDLPLAVGAYRLSRPQ